METTKAVTTTPETTPDGPAPPTPQSPTLTHYQQLADEFLRELESLSTTIPRLETPKLSSKKFVRSHLNVTLEFLAAVVAGVEQTAALKAVGKLDVVAARDTLQFLEAFRPVLDRVSAFTESLRFALDSRKAALVTDAQQIYHIAKGVARDPGSVEVAALVANLKQLLGRRGPKKAALKKAQQTPPAKSIKEVERAA